MPAETLAPTISSRPKRFKDVKDGQKFVFNEAGAVCVKKGKGFICEGKFTAFHDNEAGVVFRS